MVVGSWSTTPPRNEGPDAEAPGPRVGDKHHLPALPPAVCSDAARLIRGDWSEITGTNRSPPSLRQDCGPRRQRTVRTGDLTVCSPSLLLRNSLVVHVSCSAGREPLDQRS